MTCIDVVIPVLNEVKKIRPQIERVLQDPHVAHVYVVDGESDDGTFKEAQALKNITLIQTRPSRGWQQDQGAKQGNAPIILFLHADVTLPQGWGSLITQALENKKYAGGAFQIQTLPDPAYKSWADSLLFLANLRSRYTSLPYGDQCIFVRRTVFEKIGGYPDQCIFEDLEFSKKLLKYGKLKILKKK